jgi:hypothetical protein
MEFETRKTDYLTLRFNRKRTVPVTIFLRALAAVDDGLADSSLKEGTDEELMELFSEVDNNPDRMFIASTLYQEPECNFQKDVRLPRQHCWSFLNECALVIQQPWRTPVIFWRSSYLINAIMTWSALVDISSTRSLSYTIKCPSPIARLPNWISNTWFGV